VPLLLVEETGARHRQQLVDGQVRVLVVRRPAEHRRHDEIGVAHGERRVVEPERPRPCGTEGVDEHVGAGEQRVELPASGEGVPEVDLDAALRAVPGAEPGVGA
jgi:hypothetical protein